MTWLKSAWTSIKGAAKWAWVALAVAVVTLFALWRGERKGRVVAEGERDSARDSAKRERDVSDAKAKAHADAEVKRRLINEQDAKAKAESDARVKHEEDAAKVEVDAVQKGVESGSLADEVNRRIDDGRL